MSFWLRVANGIDRFNETLGRGVRWLCLAVILIGAFNAVARYVGRHTEIQLSSNAYLELQWYLFSLMFLLGAGWTLHRDEHVRVDVLYARLGPRGRAWINVLGTCLFLFPFCILMVWASWPAVSNSWLVHEMSPDPGGLPRYPIKAALPVAFLLLIAQGVALLARQIAVLREPEASS